MDLITLKLTQKIFHIMKQILMHKTVLIFMLKLNQLFQTVKMSQMSVKSTTSEKLH